MKRAQISIAFQTDKPLTAYGPLAAAAERMGFDGVSLYNDLFFQPAWLPLLEVARHTERVRIGPAAANPFTCHPIDLAANIALIDEMSGGRAYLGLARGAWLEAIGLRPERPVTALREAFELVGHLLSRSDRPFKGEIFESAENSHFRWQAIRADIPFMLGSWGANTIRICLPLVDEIKLGGTASPSAVRRLRSLIDSSAVRLVVGSVCVVSEDDRAARDLGKREVALYLPVVAKLDPGVEVEPQRLERIRTASAQQDYGTAASQISDELLDQFAFAGSPARVIEQALRLFEVGVHRLEFGTPHGLTEDDGIRLLGERVLPEVRRELMS